MDELAGDGRKPFYLYGGGHTAHGVMAYQDALIEFDTAWRHEEPPSCIFLASGTGSTQAGLMAGCRKLGWKDTRVRGISVARERKRGLAAVWESLAFIGELPVHYRDETHFEDAFLFGGYGRGTPGLNEFTEVIAAGSGLILDTTYTGKAFYGMTEILAKEKPRGEVVFWHTGGLLNLMS
jgi:D-cysteine desulfhydrase